MSKIEYKYSEDRILADLKAYIDKTYNQHYKSDQQDIQCLDAWIAMGDATPTFRNTAMKYLWRYGKKNGNNMDDLMKALHYILFALHNDHYKGR
jgi:predicted ATP-dependent protease